MERPKQFMDFESDEVLLKYLSDLNCYIDQLLESHPQGSKEGVSEKELKTEFVKLLSDSIIGDKNLQQTNDAFEALWCKFLSKLSNSPKEVKESTPEFPDMEKVIESLRKSKVYRNKIQSTLDTLKDVDFSPLVLSTNTPNTNSKEGVRQEIIDELINTPHSENFIEGVKSEMAHHLNRWGDESHVYPAHFVMVITFIAGKLTKAIWDKDKAKFEHHLTTIGAVCGTAHKYLNGESEVNNWFSLLPNHNSGEEKE